MKPFQIFLIFFIILTLLLVLSFLFPEEGVKGVGGITLRFPRYQELLSKTSEPDHSNISHILEQSKVLVDRDEEEPSQSDSSINIQSGDTIPTDSSKPIFYTGYQPDSLKKLVYPISYPDNDPTVLFPFFRKLENISNMDKPLRILHYGDSQIEGDRITSYIRNKLQEEFGGYGPGLFSPDMVVQHTLSLKQRTSSNWKRYSIKDIRNGIIDHQRLGVMMNFGRYLFPDTTALRDTIIYEAEIEIGPSGLGYSRVEYFDQCNLFYGYNRFPVEFSIEASGLTIRVDTLPANQSFHILSVEIPGKHNRFLVKFKGADSPEIYGISLESNRGILVDNIPMRGSSGLDFSRSDTVLLRRMFNQLNTGLLLLEFGVNVAPNIVKGYTWYENRFYEQLILLRSLRPEMSILVMGISDLSRKVNDSYESYPNIKQIRDAQKNAAFRAGCAFWDTYEAMGGENSMPEWVFADPPLARPDFIHFSNLGSKVIGEMFHNALMEGYHEYLLMRKE